MKATMPRSNPTLRAKQLPSPSVQREQAPDIGCDPVRQSLLVLLILVMMVEHGAIRQLPACQAFAQFLGNAWTGLEERGERILGYLVNDGPGKCGEFAIHCLTGEQSEFAKIISRRQPNDLDLAAVLLHRPDQNAIADNT